MQLAITIIGDTDDGILEEIIMRNAEHQCQIVDLKASVFNDAYCAYLLVEGNWNQLSKYESTLHAIQKLLNCSIFSHRIENLKNVDLLPISIEIIGLASSDLLNRAILFFADKDIDVIETNAHRYPAPYLNAQLMSARFIVSLAGESLFQLQDELMYLCNELNADLLFEPFKLGA